MNRTELYERVYAPQSRIISLSPLKWKFQILSKSGKELTLIGGQQ